MTLNGERVLIITAAWRALTIDAEAFGLAQPWTLLTAVENRFGFVDWDDSITDEIEDAWINSIQT